MIEGVTSTYLDVTWDVPQESVLGPLLFLIFMKDISVEIRSNIRLYADDCVLYSVIKSKANFLVLQEYIDRISRWYAYWKIKLNIN